MASTTSISDLPVGSSGNNASPSNNITLETNDKIPPAVVPQVSQAPLACTNAKTSKPLQNRSAFKRQISIKKLPTYSQVGGLESRPKCSRTCLGASS